MFPRHDGRRRGGFSEPSNTALARKMGHPEVVAVFPRQWEPRLQNRCANRQTHTDDRIKLGFIQTVSFPLGVQSGGQWGCRGSIFGFRDMSRSLSFSMGPLGCQDDLLNGGDSGEGAATGPSGALSPNPEQRPVLLSPWPCPLQELRSWWLRTF